MGFIFGGGTGQTYEDVQRKRRMAEQLMQANARTPRNVGEGLHAIGRALMARRLADQAGTREGELRSEFDAQLAGLLGGGATQIAATGTTPTGKMAETIKAGLMQRGLPEHVADGFIMNFQDESGLNPSINETSPLVPGSRGGFGLAQWTGPRRKELEAFAAQRGVPAGDVNTQLDFLMSELQGPESKAAEAILSSQNAGSAAQAIARDFLRPAQEHLDRRMQKYGGVSVTGAPVQQGPDARQILGLMNNPMATPAQKQYLGALLNQQVAANRPMTALEQAQLQSAQIGIEQQRRDLSATSGRATERDASGRLRYLDTGEYVFEGGEKDTRTTAQKNAEYFMDMGVPQDQALQMARGGQTINVGGQEQTAGWKKLDEKYADEWLEWTRGGGADSAKQIAQLEGVLNKLEGGEDLTGPALGMTPDALQTIFAPEALDAREKVEEVVQRNLRVILGAQFTQKEGERLIARAYNQSLSPKQNAMRLRGLVGQMRAAANAKAEMAEYFNANGTLQGFEARTVVPDIQDFHAVFDRMDADMGVGDQVDKPQESDDDFLKRLGLR